MYERNWISLGREVDMSESVNRVWIDSMSRWLGRDVLVLFKGVFLLGLL